MGGGAGGPWAAEKTGQCRRSLGPRSLTLALALSGRL